MIKDKDAKDHSFADALQSGIYVKLKLLLRCYPDCAWLRQAVDMNQPYQTGYESESTGNYVFGTNGIRHLTDTF